MSGISTSTIVGAVRAGMDVVDAQKADVTIIQSRAFDEIVSAVLSDTGTIFAEDVDWATIGVAAGVFVQLSGATQSDNNQVFKITAVDDDTLTVDVTTNPMVDETVAKLRVMTTVYNPWTGVNSSIPSYTLTKGWFAMYTLRMIQDGGFVGRDIRQGDQKFIIDKRDSEVVPVAGSKVVKSDGTLFDVIDTENDPYDLVTIIQLRRAE